jgi:hypothetical protein
MWQDQDGKTRLTFIPVAIYSSAALFYSYSSQVIHEWLNSTEKQALCGNI